jgi:hypothetical protein
MRISLVAAVAALLIAAEARAEQIDGVQTLCNATAEQLESTHPIRMHWSWSQICCPVLSPAGRRNAGCIRNPDKKVVVKWQSCIDPVGDELRQRCLREGVRTK